ncbi:MAG: lipoyl(octanoyl) transferase LipB [Alphaproteobacteria bacterium]|nr:lipoyl(octanoyl) transferase LipB [Alphaproteobacteria bacterium]
MSDQMIYHSFDHYPYAQCLVDMERTVQQIIHGALPQQIWFLEHESVYTMGRSAQESELLSGDLPVYENNRGGRYTYHGPGQLVVYTMIHLKSHGLSVHQYVRSLEEWVIQTLQHFGVESFTCPGRVGVWVRHNGGERKIAAIGVHITKGVSWHGLCLNIHPELSHYQGIIPCGIREHGVTSLHDMGICVPRHDVETVLKVYCPFK